MSNAAFNHGWKELSTNGFVTSLPGATIAILSAMGGQAYVRYLLSIQEK